MADEAWKGMVDHGAHQQARAVLFAGEDEAKVPLNGLLTMVAARRGDRWQFVAFSNTPTGRGRNVRSLWIAKIRRVPLGRPRSVGKTSL
jgi:hypothetical protein